VAIRPNFIKDLKFVFDHDRCNNAISNQFLSDLSKVHRMVTFGDVKMAEESSIDELLNLGRQLDKIRSYTRDKVTEKIEPLRKTDPENPLFCNVSLYAPMDYGRLEVAHTRTLAWLLDPSKEHGFGASLLSALFPLFDDEIAKNRPFKIKDVRSENLHYDSDNEILGRTDIWIEGKWDDNKKSFLIVIEAKIDAPEGKDQLDRYEKAIYGFNIEDVFCVFLTPNGREAEGKKGRNWHPISFSRIAGRLAVVSRDLKKAPGYYYLRFYVTSIIRDILGWKKIEESNPYQLLSYLDQMKGEN
jgi:hypothetical protein